jgi:hypothetical protein
MRANLLLTVTCRPLGQRAISDLLRLRSDKIRTQVKRLLHRAGRTPEEIEQQDRSEWTLEASTASGDVNRAILRLLSRLPKDFAARLRKLPNAKVRLSIALLEPVRGCSFFRTPSKVVARLGSLGASLEIVVFSQKAFSRWIAIAETE